MKEIPRFPGYEITKDGRIWSKPKYRHSGKWLTPFINKTGNHLRVCLQKNKKRHFRYVHRLVLETFVGPCPKRMGCRHLDGNPRNNQLNNLCWGTQSENIQDAVNHGTCAGLQHYPKKLNEEQVRLIFNAYHDGANTTRELADYFNVSMTHIRDIVNKKWWRHLWT